MKEKKITKEKEIEFKERYLTATKNMTCDGCGDEKAIDKGVTYLEHIANDGDSSHVMVFCPRCIFAIKSRQAHSSEPFDVHPGDLEFDKLPNRFKSAWKQLQVRITKNLKKGMKPNDAWHEAAERLVDELGMRHIYERDVLLAKQAEKFHNARMEIEKEVAKVKRRITKTKKETLEIIENLAKLRLAVKNAIARRQDTTDILEKMVEAIKDLRSQWEKL